MNRARRDANAWYRVPMVWLLIALPLSAVAGGFTTLWLAIRSNDGLVVDDYYRRGIEINRDLDRDRAAAARGITASLRVGAARREARIVLNLPSADLPAPLNVQLLHATRAGFDRHFAVMPAANGSYPVSLKGLAPGHYYVELAAGDWRLVGSLRLPEDTVATLTPVAGLAPR